MDFDMLAGIFFKVRVSHCDEVSVRHGSYNDSITLQL